MQVNIKHELNEKELLEAKKLYKESFGDSDEFIEYYFGTYAKNNKAWYGFDEKDNLIFMAWLNQKRLFMNGEKIRVGLIVAVATKKEFQGKGIMRDFFQKWLNEITLYYKQIFIQAYNWNVYKSFDFHNCTIKKKYILRKDQFLKPCQIFETTNYDLVNDIYNDFVKIQGIENFTYRTEKENKTVLKMFEAAGEKILHSKKAYVIVSGDGSFIIDFAFTDFKEFMRLLSHLKFGTEILTFIDLDKRYFTLLPEEKLETKILSYKDEIKILFNEQF